MCVKHDIRSELKRHETLLIHTSEASGKSNETGKSIVVKQSRQWNGDVLYMYRRSQRAKWYPINRYRNNITTRSRHDSVPAVHMLAFALSRRAVSSLTQYPFALLYPQTRLSAFPDVEVSIGLGCRWMSGNLTVFPPSTTNRSS